MLHNDVLPSYQERGLPVEKILTDNGTDNGREFFGTDTHPFELYLALSDIGHTHTKVKHPYTNDNALAVPPHGEGGVLRDGAARDLL